MSVNGVSALERGHRRTPHRETLSLLAGALALDDKQRREFEAAAARSVLLGRGSSVMVGPWHDSATASLPLALTSFVGRKTDLREIAGLVRDHRMVTVTGAGGIGKTRTATQIARELGDAGDCAVCFVGFAPIRDPSLVAPTIASALGVQEVPKRPLLETLRAYLRNKSLLLILDNCEHVIEEVAIVVEALLHCCPRVCILATSREPLRAAGEHAYRLPPLTANDAVGLFADRACAVDHRFAVTNENASEIEQICRSVDGMPLAIELAAARVNVFSVKALAAKLDDRLSILIGGERTADPRRQTMRATIEWSYNLLSWKEQRVFERLAIFAGGCTLSIATNVCACENVGENEVPGLLSSLVDKSLVVVDLEGNEPRYHLFESFRQYAHERLVARGEDQLIARRHALAYLGLAESLAEVQEYEPKSVWWARSAGEEHNLRAALEWSLSDRNDVPLGQRLASTVTAWMSIVLEDGRSWTTAALSLAHEEIPKEVLAALHYAQSTIDVSHFQYNAAFASAEEALMLYREVGDSLGAMRAQCDLGEALSFLGRREEAQEVLEDALRLARHLGGRCRQSLAIVLRRLAVSTNDVVAGRGYIAEALQISNALGRASDNACLVALAACEFRAGNVDLALKHARDALVIAPSDGFSRIVALNWLSRYLVEVARYDEAKKTSYELFNLAHEYHLDVQVACAVDLAACAAILQAQETGDRAPSACAKAGQLLGFVDARLEALASGRDFIERPQYERALAVLLELLGSDALAKLMAAGATMSEDQAFEEAFAIC
jgi:predicted ATPase